MPVLRQGDVVEGGEGLGWEVVRRIGEGQFSEVYQVQDMRTQEQVGGGRLGSRWAALLALSSMFPTPTCRLFPPAAACPPAARAQD